MKIEFRIQNLELRSFLFSVFMAVMIISNVCLADEGLVRKAMKEGLVYLEVSSYGYDQFRPWKNTDVQRRSGVGCAVSGNQAITTAWNLIDATLIKAQVFGQNEFIEAKVKVIDYEIDLALIEFEPNSLKKPLKPVKFADNFKRGDKLNYYWINNAGELTSGQGFLDRADVHGSTVSYSDFLTYVVTNTSQETSTGQIYFDGDTAIGIACWANGETEAGLIPAVIINNFLSRVKEPNYSSVPTAGFATAELLDPMRRDYLKMPKTMKNGMEVVSVFNLGTGRDSLKKQDVILAIDGKELDAYGRFSHPMYDRISFHHLITSHKAGDEINFDIWREGKKEQIKVKAENFKAEEMLVPFYGYGKQPKYVVMGGYVFEQMTRPYLVNFGKDWDGKVSPHMLYYLRDKAFKPTIQRKDVVLLSYILPSPISIGYIDLTQLIVKSINGMPISRIDDIIRAQKMNPESKFDVIEFEFDNPTVVIPREQLQQANTLIGTNYMIRKLINVN